MTMKQAPISHSHNELTPDIVDRLAKTTPEAPYALYPVSPVSYEEGFQTFTYKDFANAINGLAWWIKDNLGTSTTFDVLAYIGPNDIRYTALLLAAIKTGHVAFFTSPRNSGAAHDALFNRLKCQTILTPSPAPPALETILGLRSMKHLYVPSVAELLDTPYPHYPFNKTLETSRSDPFMIVHTSGSTGIPEPLIWRNETIARHTYLVARDAPPGFQSQCGLLLGKRVFNTFPPFHGACLGLHLVVCVPFGTVSIAPLSGAISSAEGVVNALKKAPADAAFLVPSIAADLAEDSSLLDYCSQNLETILYAGGDLPQALGDTIASKLSIRCQYGSSEFGLAAQTIPPEMTAADWRFVQFPTEMGLHFDEVTPGLFELTIRRDARIEENQLTFTIGPTLQNLDVYRSRDLFEKHPIIPNCWGWRARADDVIVFLNGEKTNPVSMENHVVASNKNVGAALVIGMQRFQAALLVEPAQSLSNFTPEEADAFIEEIWPSVEEANKTSPAHARVEKSLILLTNSEKAMIRSGKGTVQRQATIDQFSVEIDELYLKADAYPGGVEKASVDITNLEQVSQFVKETVSRIEPGLLKGGDDNFFALGMDSLMAIRLTRALKYGLAIPDLSVSVIHKNPSVEQLTRYLMNTQMENGQHDPKALQQPELGTLLEEYKQTFKNMDAQKAESGERAKSEVVILTGSTGSLGIHLLYTLLTHPNVSHVYALNRRDNAEEIHQAKANASNFPLNQHQGRISFFQVSLDQPLLGLDQPTYEKLRIQTTLIIHNAWPVNFILPFQAFKPHFNGLVNLFQMSNSRTNPPKLLYISSMSSVARFPSRTIPEQVIYDHNASYPMGYAQSKLFSELLCDMAAHKLNLPVSFTRIGQIAGPVRDAGTGVWNTAEWLPSLITTSISLGAIPESLGAELNIIDWIPVDILAEALVQLGLSRDLDNQASNRAEVFNIFGQHSRSWEEILPYFVNSIEKHVRRVVKIVPLRLWLEILKKTAETAGVDAARVVRTLPAIKLQGFYEDRLMGGEKVGEWETERATSKSAALKNMPAVGAEWVDIWVKSWTDALNEARV